MVSEYQLKIADLYNIPNNNAKKLVPNLFDKENVILYKSLQLYFTSCCRIQSISVVKTIY